MTVDVEAQELKVGDRVLVEMRVRRILEKASGLVVILAHLENDDVDVNRLKVTDCQVKIYAKEQAVEIHT